jgi:hypothetical protein
MSVCYVSVRHAASRYVAWPEISGWTVYDVTTGRPAAWNGLVLGGLHLDDATAVVLFLNRTHCELRRSSLH